MGYLVLKILALWGCASILVKIIELLFYVSIKEDWVKLISKGATFIKQSIFEIELNENVRLWSFKIIQVYTKLHLRKKFPIIAC